jgi:hypothetical protein
MIPPEKLAWMAAILDMQGRTHRKENQTRATPQLVLRVDSAHLGVISELCRLTGISREPRPPAPGKEWDRRGCTEHCAEAHIHVEIDSQPAIGRWTLTGGALAVVLFSVIPYMVTDRGFTDLMNEAMANLVTTGKGAHAVKRSVMRLAELGWEIPPDIAKRLRLTRRGKPLMVVPA